MSSLGRRASISLRIKAERRHDPEYRRLCDGYRLADDAKRVYCFHIRKTGGTSLARSFLTLGGEEVEEVHRRIEASRLKRTISDGYAYVAHNKTLLEEGQYFFGWSHIPAHALELPPSTFTVTVLRDPVRRAVSYYNYLVHGDEPGTQFPVPQHERELARDGFDAFLDRAPRRELMRQLFTFSRNFDVGEAEQRIRGCSFVFSSESYDEGLAELARRLELPLLSRHDRVTPKSSAPTTGQLERLREMLEPEYELFRRIDAPVEAGI